MTDHSALISYLYGYAQQGSVTPAMVVAELERRLLNEEPRKTALACSIHTRPVLDCEECFGTMAQRLDELEREMGIHTPTNNVSVPAWISIADQWPPRHKHVWCYNRDGRQFEGCICAGMHRPFMTYPWGDGSPSNTAPSWIDVTHWRPLSDPPEGAK